MRRFLLFFTAVAVLILGSCAPRQQMPEKEQVQNAMYYYKIGLSYLNSGNNSQALYYLNKAYSIDPNNPEILNALGIAYSNVGEYKKAKEFLLKAIEKDPDRAETYTNLGTILAKEKQYEKALWYFQRAVENPSYMKKDLVFYNMALIYKQMGNLKLYEENLKKALSYNSFLLPAYVALGDFYLQQKKYQDALAVYLSAKDKGLVSPYIYLGLGKVYYHLGEYEKAKEYLIKAKKLARNNDFLLLEIERFIRKTDQKIIQKTEEKLEQQLSIAKQEETAIKKPPVIAEEKPVEEKPAIGEEKTAKIEKQEEEKVEKTGEELIAKKEVAPQTPKKVVKPKIRFYVLVGRFTDEEKAFQLVETLRQKGFTPELKKEYIDEKPVYSVIIGYFREYREASRFYRKKLRPLGIRGIVKFTRK
ncbi:SPOR domain-containing protein [Persephonella sp.]